MAYRAPTAVNRAYAKVPIERPRASVHVLVPTLTLRRPALELTGSPMFVTSARVRSLFVLLPIKSTYFSRNLNRGHKNPRGKDAPPLLVVSSLLPVLMRAEEGGFYCRLRNALVP